MRQLILVIVVAMGVGGCSASPLPSAEDAPFEDGPCSRVAAERAYDAEVNGYGKDIQRRVRMEAYAECLRWGRRCFVTRP